MHLLLVVLLAIDPSWLHWRSIGPYRGGRTVAVCGVVQKPNVFYIAPVNGGVWKTDDYGHTWTPIFDDQPTASIGALAVAPSDPQIVYAGSGEGLHRPDLSVGDGVYRSRDGGRTWTHLGLRDAQQIPAIAVDPRDARRLFVAAAGHPYGPNRERGIFRSLDGGETFEKVLYKDDNTGGADVVIDPRDPKIVYASLWQAREAPWENGDWNGATAGIYKSADGGTTWSQLTRGLPADIMQAHLAIAPSEPARLVATVGAKSGTSIVRSDDRGASWTVITKDPRPATRIGGGDLPVPRIDPKHADVVYIASTVSWKSSDGGKTWSALRGAPGGDDYQNVWIHPSDPDVIILGSDQGAVITVNGGSSWSEWYSQPTAQLYHVNADNAFPYRVCSGQQESGSVCIASRGGDGEITMRDWHPVGAEEYGYVVPDPLDADTIYGGKIGRYDRRTGQVRDVSPRITRGPDYRVVRTQPIAFAPNDPHTLYFAANRLWKSTNGGAAWTPISPDLARATWDVPATVGVYTPQAKVERRGVIYAIAPSRVDGRTIWAGTDDGTIHVTVDGGAHWRDVTPPTLTAWEKVSILEASHTNGKVAYAAINTLRLDDLRPHILRTRDGGATWQEIVAGIPANENVNVVREDPKRTGLLFAGTERAVYVSFDDGDHWRSLRNDMPATSVRDLAIKDDDLIAATHGRGFWILDDISALRQDASAAPFLFEPAAAYRVRWDTNTDTPLPPDTAAGENPPDGAPIDYLLAAGARNVTLEVLDGSGAVVRRWSTDDVVPPPDDKLTIPRYWLRAPEVLHREAGMHRIVWDLHEQPLPSPKDYPIAAVPHGTAPAPTSPWVVPGTYTVVLAVDGAKQTKKLVVKMDPRVKATARDLARQNQVARGVVADLKIAGTLDAVKAELAKAPASPAVAELTKQIDAATGASPKLGTRLVRALRQVEGADVAPSAQAEQVVVELHAIVVKLGAAMKAAGVSANGAAVTIEPPEDEE
jgi:photosystem II stability/assembly factor-like uncharacterized protein